MPSYTYPAQVLIVKDGDTVKFSFRLKKCRFRKDQDLGLNVFIEKGWICRHETIRLYGINSNEKKTEAGKLAARWLSEMLPLNTWITVDTIKAAGVTEKYGRYLGILLRTGDPDSLNKQAVDSGHALPWDGKGSKPV